eukprot:788095_1
MVDGLGKALLEHLGLETTFEKLLGGELQHEIKLKLVLGEEAVTAHPSEKGGTLEDTLGVLGIKGEEGTGRLTELGQRILATPDLALASESVLSNKLQLGIKTLLLER